MKSPATVFCRGFIRQNYLSLESRRITGTLYHYKTLWRKGSSCLSSKEQAQVSYISLLWESSGNSPWTTSKSLWSGVFNKRLSQPKCNAIWDYKVIDYICTLGNDKNSSTKIITLKLSILLAFFLSNRASELTYLNIRYVWGKPSIFYFSKLLQSSKVKVISLFEWRSFEKVELCIIRCMNTICVNFKCLKERGNNAASFKPLSINPTRWSNTLTKFTSNSWQIVWVCLAILWGWC